MTAPDASTTTSTPDVSVIMPAWKAADYIEATIDSVLTSRGVSVELIIVDDASPDETFKVIQQRAMQDERIRVCQLARNGGPSAARNRALAMARGRYVAVVDADDKVTEARLLKLVRLADQSNADIIVDNMVETNADGERISKKNFLRSRVFQTPRDISLPDYIRYNQPLKSGDCLGYLKPLFRRETLVQQKARYDTALRNSEDYYLVANLLANGARMIYTPYAGYLYQRAAGSTSHRLTPAHTTAWLTAELAFHDAHLENASPEGARYLRSRMRGLHDVDQFVRVVEALKARRLKETARLLSDDLHAASFTLTWLAKIAWQRLTAFKDHIAGEKPALV